MPTLTKKILNAVETQARYVQEYAKDAAVAIEIIGQLDLDEDTSVSPSGGLIYIWTSKREDVEKILSVAPIGEIWRKEPTSNGIQYSCSIREGVSVTIFATGDALPPTCQLVEEEVTIPAQPERKEVRKVVKCNTPTVEVGSAADTEDKGIAATVLSDDNSVETDESGCEKEIL